MKKALITGITGQDVSYLAEFLPEKAYEVHKIKRRSFLFNRQCIDYIYQDPHVENSRFKLHYGDLYDTFNLTRSRKIARGLANIALGLESCLHIGNIDALRNWGHAKDNVCMQWLMQQWDDTSDYVIAMGEKNSVRDFITWTANALGIDIEFKGTGVGAIGVVIGIFGDLSPNILIGKKIVNIDSLYFRSAEAETLLGDPTKAKDELGWEPKITAQECVKKWWKKTIRLRVARHSLTSINLNFLCLLRANKIP